MTRAPTPNPVAGRSLRAPILWGAGGWMISFSPLPPGFIAEYRDEIGNIRTGASGDAGYVSDLVVRGLAQSSDPAERTALLDVLDELMGMGAFGIDDAVSVAER